MNLFPVPEKPEESKGPTAPDRPAKRKPGRPPTKKEADDAMDIINKAQAEKDKEKAEKEAADRATLLQIRQAQEELKKKEAAKLEEINQKIKRKLRENEQRKSEQERLNKIQSYQEQSNGKIKWKSFNFGKVVCGYIKDKLCFQIEHRIITYNLYVKDKALLEKFKGKSYQGCSTELFKLKAKSEKLI